MSSTSHGVYLEGSGGHGRTSLSSGGEPQVAPASLSDDKGDDEGAGVAGSTQMETDPPNVAPMDEALWGTLPEDLQDRILAWLPFPAFARACTVCKRYNLTYTSLHSSNVVAGLLVSLCMIASRLGRGSTSHLQSSTLLLSLFSYGCRNTPISLLISSWARAKYCWVKYQQCWKAWFRGCKSWALAFKRAVHSCLRVRERKCTSYIKAHWFSVYSVPDEIMAAETLQCHHQLICHGLGENSTVLEGMF